MIRLNVVMEDKEYKELQKYCIDKDLSVSEFVRKSIKDNMK